MSTISVYDVEYNNVLISMYTQDASNTRKKEMQDWEIHRKKQEKPSDLEQVIIPVHMYIIHALDFECQSANDLNVPIVNEWLYKLIEHLQLQILFAIVEKYNTCMIHMNMHICNHAYLCLRMYICSYVYSHCLQFIILVMRGTYCRNQQSKGRT